MNTLLHMVGFVSRGKGVSRRFLASISFCGIMLSAACVSIHPAGRSIYESPDTVVRLEWASKVSSLDDAKYSHSILLTVDQVDVLLTSISARTKVGFLRSFIGNPGMPRLFDRTDIDLLKSPIQDALAKANPGEVVVFYHAKYGRGPHARVTSGILFVRDKALVLTVTNFRHPVITMSSEVGSKDRLEDVRETINYVRDHAWVSVGEQDFAIFFDDPRHQLDRRESGLWDHPERTVAIVFPSYLEANPDPIKRAKESEEAIQQAAMPKLESEAIIELKRRLAELERTTAVSAEKTHSSLVPQASPKLPEASSPSDTDMDQVSKERLLEIIQHLEQRISELERHLTSKPPKKSTE
ncbi:MAG: hypothetical protein KF722_06600 [Nitrospira sp.]|nr:hypothetical protein [Nitrospira sp.]